MRPPPMQHKCRGEYDGAAGYLCSCASARALKDDLFDICRSLHGYVAITKVAGKPLLPYAI